MPQDLALTPLLDGTGGPELPLPAELRQLYGPLRLAAGSVFANFVSSLDGVVSLGEPGTGGKEISGGHPHDRAVMGLLRAAADVIVIGAGTLRSVPRHVWTPAAIYPQLADAYGRMRSTAPRTVVITASGDVDTALPVFTSGKAPATIVTTARGARALAPAAGLDVRVVEGQDPLDAAGILRAIAAPREARILLECGPRLMAAFLEARRVDDLFLTLAPQVAGRTPEAPREGFVTGSLFLPGAPLWGDLVDVKVAGSFLFLRYRFAAK